MNIKSLIAAAAAGLLSFGCYQYDSVPDETGGPVSVPSPDNSSPAPAPIPDPAPTPSDPTPNPSPNPTPPQQGLSLLLVDEAALEEGEFELVGETSIPFAPITVDGCGGLAANQCFCPPGFVCQAFGVADAEGLIDVTAENFATPVCLLQVSNGDTTVFFNDLEDCEPTQAPIPPNPNPVPPNPNPNPNPGFIFVTEALLEEGELEVIGQTSQLSGFITVDGCAGSPQCFCPIGNVCQAAGVVEAGEFDITAEEFAAPSCIVSVTDGINTVQAPLEGCEIGGGGD